MTEKRRPLEKDDDEGAPDRAVKDIEHPVNDKRAPHPHHTSDLRLLIRIMKTPPAERRRGDTGDRQIDRPHAKN